MAKTVDIRGLDKHTLLRALWENSTPASFFLAHPTVPRPRWDDEKVPNPMEYVDYFQGRCIKLDLSGDTVDPAMYDRDMGEGAVARVVASVVARLAARVVASLPT